MTNNTDEIYNRAAELRRRGDSTGDPAYYRKAARLFASIRMFAAVAQCNRKASGRPPVTPVCEPKHHNFTEWRDGVRWCLVCGVAEAE